MQHDPTLQIQFKQIDQAHRSARDLQIHSLPDTTTTLVDHGYQAVHTLAQIEKMMRQIQSSNEVPFVIYRTAKGMIQVQYQAIGKLFLAMAKLPSLHKLQQQLPMKTFSPSVMLLLKLLDGQEWRYVEPRYVMFDGRVAALHFNEFIEKLRARLRQPQFKKQVACWTGKASRNHKGAVKYVYRLLQQKKRLRVVRLDLSYQRNQPERHDAVLCKKHFERFIGNWRHNQLFDSVVGFIWRLEYGQEMGFHFHWILLFDGNEIWKEEWYADQIGEYWREQITAGNGAFHNCNSAAKENGHDKSPEYGLGKLKYDDNRKFKVVVEQVIGYLTKADELMKSVGFVGRAFGRGLVR